MNKFPYTALWAERLEAKELDKKYQKTEEDLKAVQSVGQIVAEVLKQLDDERCELGFLLLLVTAPLLLYGYRALDSATPSLSTRETN
jgi:ATP-dependent 26S proteasome regulatory subunit